MEKEDKSSKKLISSIRETGPYLGLGSQLAATIILSFFFGRWLDGQLESEPVLTIIFSFLGGAAGIYNFIKTVLNINSKKPIEKD
ncbi:MAG: AtpZ/AtpI family protein [Melioribacteraceae bacterium]|nr:AtpZ/AtpI family protein [Melioribacteraceae bacterium]